jgi:hypothetical protein
VLLASHWRRRMVTLLIVSVLPGCPVADRHTNLFASHWRAQRWTDQLAANRRSGLRAVMRASAVRVLSVRVPSCAFS